MKPKQRLKLGDLDLSVIDPFERSTEYIYNEIFVDDCYRHPRIKLPDQAMIVDVGANIGIFTIWAARTYAPRAIHAYEASPTTYDYLTENVARHIEKSVVTVTCVNRAVSREAGRELVLHQPPWVSGLATILDGRTLPWIDELRAKGELYTHTVQSTTLSQQMAAHDITTIDLLKIDVEGHFMEVLDGIAAPDVARIRSIILEAEYTETLGHSHASITSYLRERGFTVDAQDAAQVMVYAWRE